MPSVPSIGSSQQALKMPGEACREFDQAYP
jgi:hypothetical protein